jgi:hypothetical protein
MNMSQIYVEVSEVVPAPAGKVYAVLADYREGHPAILPQPYFREMVIEQGGQGAGTIIRVAMDVMGVKRHYRMAVSEPEPGRMLVENDPEAGVKTTFTVAPLNGGQRSLVTIATETQTQGGLQGLMERFINPPITRRIYRQELQQLAEYVQRKG